MKIEIKFIENNQRINGWKVTYKDKYADNLAYEEMIGLIISITVPYNKPCLQWLKTKEEHQKWKDDLNKQY